MLIALGAVLVAVAVIATVLVTRSSTSSNQASKEVFLEPISSAQDPYSPPVGQDVSVTPLAPTTVTAGASTTTSAATTTTSAPPAGGGATAITQRFGGTPGLYGGTQRRAECNKEQLVAFLQQNPAKGDAWAATLGIRSGDIATYVAGLTPVLLRSDTRVTNHGYRDGHATSIQSVLQAGTAVLVDSYGRPVTKCYCGNPLTPPIAYPTLYYGHRWTDFDETHLTVITTSTVIVNVFVLVDVHTGVTFSRPVASSGDKDTSDGVAPPTSSTTTSSPSSTTTSTSSTTTTTSPPTFTLTNAEITGSYTFSGSVQPGSTPSCTAYHGTLDITAQGDGAARQIGLRNPGSPKYLAQGALGTDGSFRSTVAITGGSETITGTFHGGGGVTLEGHDHIVQNGLSCDIGLTGHKP
ncbi:MAG: hypothetical protein JWN46_829 [Acidimicrobiales bacterium]|nr:hypothetical protein [Acidimicrobiales bacterium]